MEVENIISLIGGIALFLFGMSVMGDSLKKVAGNKMEMVLYKLSGNTIKGIMLGTGVTAVIQSSSATSVMVVGFVNSGMMTVKQAIGIVMGAILGTSVTGWVLCLNSLHGAKSPLLAFLNTEVLTGIVALIGIIMWMFIKDNTAKNIGGIMMGFAVLMYGMSMMSGAIEPLRDDPHFINMLTSFKNPVLGVIAGLVLTSVIQSASAAVGILQALAVTGAVTFDMAFPIIMGIGIGASVPVLLSALGASINGKRTAFIYLIIDVVGAIICGVIFYALNAVVHFGFASAVMTMVTIALTNSLYRLGIVIFLAPGVGLLEKLICRLIPQDETYMEEQADMDRLETRFLQHPPLSIGQSKMVIDSMAGKALESVRQAVSVRQEFSRSSLKRVFDLEGLLDRYEDKLGDYLYRITMQPLTEEQSREVNRYLRVLSDFERISDHAKNIGEAADEINSKKIGFSESAERELDVMEDAVSEITELAIRSFVENDIEAALRVDPLEEVIDDLCDEMKSRHVRRVTRKECTLENGFAFNDLLTDYERISDHCTNIAVDIFEAGGTMSHEYHQSLEYRNNETFRSHFEEYKKRFRI